MGTRQAISRLGGATRLLAPEGGTFYVGPRSVGAHACVATTYRLWAECQKDVAKAYATGSVAHELDHRYRQHMNSSGSPKSYVSATLQVSRSFDLPLGISAAAVARSVATVTVEQVCTTLWAALSLRIEALRGGVDTGLYMRQHGKLVAPDRAACFIVSAVAINRDHPQTVGLVQWCAYRRWRAMVAGELLALLAPAQPMSRATKLDLGEQFLADLYGPAVMSHNDPAPISLHALQSDDDLIDLFAAHFMVPQHVALQECLIDVVLPRVLADKAAMPELLVEYVNAAVSVFGTVPRSHERRGRAPTLDVSAVSFKTSAYLVRGYIRQTAEVGPRVPNRSQSAAMRSALRVHEALKNPLTNNKVQKHEAMLNKISELDPKWYDVCIEALRK